MSKFKPVRRRKYLPKTGNYQGVPPAVDPSFKNRLREFDPKLEIDFDRETHRFAIYRKMPVGDSFKIMVVAGPEGEFRQPDMRDIAALHGADLWRKGRLRDFVRTSEAKILDNMRKEEKEAEDTFREASIDDRIQLRRMYRREVLNEGKANAEYRRVDPNQRGLSLEQIKSARAAGKDPWAGTEKVQ